MKSVFLFVFTVFFSPSFSQDLVASLSSDGKPFVSIPVEKGRTLAATLEHYGLDKKLAADAVKSGGNYLLPLGAVVEKDGSDKIWYRTVQQESLQALSVKFGVDEQFLSAINKSQSDFFPKGKYVLLGFVRSNNTASAASPVMVTSASVPGQIMDTVPVAIGVNVNDVLKIDSIGGLPVPVGAGYYELEYLAKNKYRKEGRMGLFKTLGGWYDRKYYMLSNELPVGTVVRVFNKANGRYVYAKVISKMPGLKDDAQLLLRLNDAGRAALDVWNDDDEINVVVSN